MRIKIVEHLNKIEKQVRYFIYTLVGVIATCVACSILTQFSKPQVPIDELMQMLQTLKV
jgi:hypothetical protein